MANNGAVTYGTSLGRTLATGWHLLPPGSIAAGVPAADTWYYVQMSSATVGVVFNNTYTIGPTAAPASPTAFVTTGPGAFTGSTTLATGPAVSIGAGTMGNLGTLRSESSNSNNNSAGVKQFSVVLGATQFLNISQTTVTTAGIAVDITNQGDATHQMGDVAVNSFTPQGSAMGAIFGTENTAAALTLSIRLIKGVATDFAIIERYLNLLTAQASGNG